MISEAQRLALLEAGKMKLAASARLAEGGSEARYEAAVLFHAAARAERRALLAIESPPPEERLRSAIEQCGCLMDGLDPTAVLEAAWSEVLEASIGLPEPTVRALRARIDPRMEAFIAEHARVLAKTPALLALVATDERRPTAVEKDLRTFVKAFPGDARAWGLLSRSAAGRGARGVRDAWNAIRRARALAPAEPQLLAIEIELMPRARPATETESVLASVYADIQRGDGDADLCFSFVWAALYLAEQSRRNRDALLRQALDVATIGQGLPPLWPFDRRVFRAFQLIVRELLAGVRPSVEILYRCGLGTWVAAGTGEDPISLLLARRLRLRPAQAA